MSFVGIDIKVVAWDDEGGGAVAEDWLEVPPAVDAHNVEDYVFGRFGRPVDVAVGATDAFGEIVMGWVYPAGSLDQLSLPSEGLELMVVPFVRFPDGTRRELFEYTAELNSEFRALVAGIDPTVAELAGPAPVELHDRLEHEQPWLHSAEREELELQLSGWLRRMVAEGWTYLIAEVTGSGRYVQFLVHDGTWLRGEVVGDRYLDGHDPLSADEQQRLVDLGWNPPGEHGDESGNFWVDWGEEPHDDGAEPVGERDVREAARFAAAALCDAFDVSSADAVEVMTGPASHVED